MRTVEEEEEEHRGATGMKDVSLPVCHKSSVLLCDRLADRASSGSLGTYRLLLQSHIFEKLLSFSEAEIESVRAKPLVWCFGADVVKSR